MKKRILSVALAVLTISSAFAGCSYAAPKKGDEKTIKIGGLAPLTGDVSIYGVAANNGIELAVKDINSKGGILGKKIEYIRYDEKGDPTEALNAYNKLVQNDKIVALVGDVTSKPTIAVAQKAARDNIPMITATGTAADITKAGKNVFRACFIDPFQGQLMANYAFEKLGAKTAAIMYDTGDDYSAGVADAFEKEAKKIGIKITNKEGYASKSVDFNSQLTKIKASNPDVLLIPCYYSDVALIAVQAKKMGLKSRFLGSDGWDGVLSKINKSNLDALKGCRFCSQYSAENKDADLQAFLQKFKDTYKDSEPNMFSVLGYDAMGMMAAAIEKAGSTDSDKIIKAMQNLKYKGLTGTTTFDAKRNPIREAVITTIDGNKYAMVENYKMQ